jgi:hypothetical protein
MIGRTVHYFHPGDVGEELVPTAALVVGHNAAQDAVEELGPKDEGGPRAARPAQPESFVLRVFRRDGGDGLIMNARQSDEPRRGYWSHLEE